MSNHELQEEEREVLRSIYDSDDHYKELSPTSFTYRVGDVGEAKSFLLEVTWDDAYPDELPCISLDSFYNSHISSESKEAMCLSIKQEAEALIGSPMTYSLFEYAKEHADELVVPSKTSTDSADLIPESGNPVKQEKKKKEVLTKQAKRRMADRTNAQGELPRGWDWVDIIKLSKTGNSHS